MDNLFVPSAIHFEIVYLRPDKPAIVPCRVTSPLAKVSLHLEVPPEEINGTLVTYDPTRGFILQNVGPEHQGVFYCKAVTKATPQVSTKYQLLYGEGTYPIFMHPLQFVVVWKPHEENQTQVEADQRGNVP